MWENEMYKLDENSVYWPAVQLACPDHYLQHLAQGLGIENGCIAVAFFQADDMSYGTFGSSEADPKLESMARTAANDAHEKRCGAFAPDNSASYGLYRNEREIGPIAIAVSGNFPRRICKMLAENLAVLYTTLSQQTAHA